MAVETATWPRTAIGAVRKLGRRPLRVQRLSSGGSKSRASVLLLATCFIVMTSGEAAGAALDIVPVPVQMAAICVLILIALVADRGVPPLPLAIVGLTVTVGFSVLAANVDLPPRAPFFFAAAVAGGLVAASRLELHQWLRVIGVTTVAIALASLALAVLWPAVGLHQDVHYGALRGIYDHKNVLGRVLAFGMAALLYSPARTRGMRTLPRLAAFTSVGAALVMTRSATGLALVILAVAIWAFQNVFRRLEASDHRLAAGRIALLFAGGATLAVAGTQLFGLALDALGRDATLTGRTAVWARALELWGARPLTGQGFGWASPLGEAARVLTVGDYTHAHFHNGYLLILVELGLVGLIFFLLFYASIFRLYRQGRLLGSPPHFGWVISILTMVLVLNVVEQGAYQLSLFLLCGAYVYAHAYAHREPEPHELTAARQPQRAGRGDRPRTRPAQETATN